MQLEETRLCAIGTTAPGATWVNNPFLLNYRVVKLMTRLVWDLITASSPTLTVLYRFPVDLPDKMANFATMEGSNVDDSTIDGHQAPPL